MGQEYTRHTCSTRLLWNILPGLARGFRFLHISAQIAAVQTSDVGLSFVDVSAQRCGVQSPVVFFEPGHLANQLVAHFAQSPDQLSGLRGIPFPHRGIVAPVGAPGTLSRAAARRAGAVNRSDVAGRSGSRGRTYDAGKHK